MGEREKRGKKRNKERGNVKLDEVREQETERERGLPLRQREGNMTEWVGEYRENERGNILRGRGT